jgi:hypothetical protein
MEKRIGHKRFLKLVIEQSVGGRIIMEGQDWNIFKDRTGPRTIYGFI